jgi:hypothetical protein
MAHHRHRMQVAAKTALPKEPVPPVISKTLSLNMLRWTG